MQQRRDPWEPFRLWLAFTIGLYAIRAFFASGWPGAIPGWVLLMMVLVPWHGVRCCYFRPGGALPQR